MPELVLLAIVTNAPVPHTPGHNTWWYVGLVIGFVIVAVVVVVAASILAFASRISSQAREGIDLMDNARTVTLPVWALQDTNVTLTAIWRSAESIRESLTVTRFGGRV